MTPPNSKANGECNEELERFNEFYEDLLQPDSSTARSVFPFIRSKLYQFKLRSEYDEVAILLEAYLRSARHIAQGGKITNPSAWINSVSYRIIREFSRKSLRNVYVDNQVLESLTHCVDNNDTSLTDEMLKIRDAFKLLSPKEQILIYRKVVLNESWIVIQDFWLFRPRHGKEALRARSGERKKR